MPKHRKHHTHPPLVKQPHRFFSKTAIEPQGATQTITLTVNVDQKEDSVVDCFKALLGCCKKPS